MEPEKCKKCKGVGHSGKRREECPTCKGSGYVTVGRDRDGNVTITPAVRS